MSYVQPIPAEHPERWHAGQGYWLSDDGTRFASNAFHRKDRTWIATLKCDHPVLVVVPAANAPDERRKQYRERYQPSSEAEVEEIVAFAGFVGGKFHTMLAWESPCCLNDGHDAEEHASVYDLMGVNLDGKMEATAH